MRPLMGKITIRIQPGLCIIMAVVLLMIPFRWVLAWAIATAVHEGCHCLALRIGRIPVYSVEVKLHGVVMQTGTMSRKTECLCALAGPAGGLLLVFTARFYPEIVLCAFFQSLFNLMPVYPLDGGRALQCFAGAFLPAPWEGRICWAAESCVLMLALLGGFYGTVCLKLGPLPLAAAVCLLFRAERIKIPCKDGKLRVQ